VQRRVHGPFSGSCGILCVGNVLGIDVFEAFDPKRAQALRDYDEYARDNDLFLTYVIINP
jgi:hypothetical protein